MVWTGTRFEHVNHIRVEAPSRHHAASHNVLDQQQVCSVLCPWDRRGSGLSESYLGKTQHIQHQVGDQRTFNLVKGISSATQLNWLLLTVRGRSRQTAPRHCLASLLWSLIPPNSYTPPSQASCWTKWSHSHQHISPKMYMPCTNLIETWNKMVSSTLTQGNFMFLLCHMSSLRNE